MKKTTKTTKGEKVHIGTILFLKNIYSTFFKISLCLIREIFNL